MSAETTTQRRLHVAPFPHERLGDAELVQAVVRGDSEAAGVVWDRYSEQVRSVVRSALGFDSATEDLVQEVFISFVSCAADIRDGNSLRAFLAGVAIRKSLVELRRRRVRRWVTLSATGELPDSSVLAGDFSSREVLRGLYRILETLPDRRRLAFVLRHVQDLELTEVSAVLGISVSTAKREIARAVETIRIRAKNEPAVAQYLQGLQGGSYV